MKFKKFLAVVLSTVFVVCSFSAVSFTAGAMSSIIQKGESSKIKEYGIDVSKHNGVIDWEEVRGCDVDFAIIRAGYTCSDDPSKDMDDDVKFEYNYTEAKKAGIKVGVYFYSYAVTVAEAKADAKALIKRLDGKQLEYPVYYDMEDKCQNNLSTTLRTQIATSFINTMNSAGYYAGVYANANWFRNKLDYDTLVTCGPIWWAEWHSSKKADSDYNQFGMWQYTSDGRLNGLPGRVDLNVSFVDYERIMKKGGLNGYGDNRDSFYVGFIPTATYSGKPVKPTPKVQRSGVELVKGKDYKISYYHNTRVGLAVAKFDGLGVFEGFSSRRFFKIDRKGFAKVTLKKISSREYTGKQIAPTLALYDGDNRLSEDRDYNVTFSNNKKIGTATVKITGINYKGSKTSTFKIKKRDLKNCKITLSSKTVEYNGNYRYPSVNVYVGDTKVSDSHYSVSRRSHKNPGIATVTVTAKSSSGLFTGKGSATFTILPKKQTLAKVYSPSKGDLKIAIKRDSSVSGYQVVYSASEDFDTFKKVTLYGYNKNSLSVSGRQSGKTYFVKVRAFKKTASKTVYGKYSDIKKTKIK